jgi:S-adenosylmethionine-diacylglycerol 3-amino-3-carboxypropyl transferase
MSALKEPILRYANCWEDADILLEGLNPLPGSRILSIGSAGDNSFSLLMCEPSELIAIDINSIQLHLIELKKAVISHFNRQETLSFLGFETDLNRLEKYQLIRDYLSPGARSHWDHRLSDIQEGVIYTGKFERYFKKFCKWILPLIHNKSTIQGFFHPKSEQEQIQYYNERWNTWSWRALFKIYFSKYMMAKIGRDPEFLKEVDIHVGDHIFERAERQLKNTSSFTNFILRFNLTAQFDRLLPHYLKAENFDVIQKNIDRLIIKEGYLQDFQGTSSSFDCMNLSNIFEYMNPITFEQNAKWIADALQPQGKVAYWNLMVDRQLSQLLPTHFQYNQVLSETLSQKDKGFFYQRFLVESKK